MNRIPYSVFSRIAIKFQYNSSIIPAILDTWPLYINKKIKKLQGKWIFENEHKCDTIEHNQNNWLYKALLGSNDF